MIQLKVENFSSEELDQAVYIQMQELSEGFLSSLGAKPLRLIFEHAALSEWGILILAKSSDEDKVIGYVLGSVNTGKFYKDFLLCRFFSAVICFLPKLLSWDRIKKAFETLCYPIKKEKKIDNGCNAELLDLAVKNTFHGKRVAQRLFMYFVDQCKRKGVARFDIPTTQGLERAHHFYEKVGAKKVKMIKVHGTQQTFLFRYKIN